MSEEITHVHLAFDDSSCRLGFYYLEEYQLEIFIRTLQVGGPVDGFRYLFDTVVPTQSMTEQSGPVVRYSMHDHEVALRELISDHNNYFPNEIGEEGEF